jgi:Tol biopolymer transport system component
MKAFSLTGVILAVVFGVSVAGQSTAPSYVLDWLPQPENQGLLGALHARLSQWLDVVVRYTSPDVPYQSRRLWRVSADGSGPCLMASDTGVNQPRWAKSNFILFLVSADTNGDGKIDFRDEFEIRVLSPNRALSKTVGQAASAAWSPDGRFIAVIHQQELAVIDTSGNIVPASDRPTGQIVLADSLNPELAGDFRAVNPRTGSTAPLSEDLARKYLWLPMMAPGGTKVVYADATRKNILIRSVGETSGHKLIGGDASYLDPAWSPDEKYVLYVSNKEGGASCVSPR